jgi:hypothetical protein
MDEVTIGVQIDLKHPEDFLLVKESLTRIGVASKKNKTLYQSAHILHKRGKYYICHFKELFTLDGKPSTISADDIARRNLITSLLSDWGLVMIQDNSLVDEKAPLHSIKIIPFKEKGEWQLESKYSLGNKSR